MLHTDLDPPPDRVGLVDGAGEVGGDVVDVDERVRRVRVAERRQPVLAQIALPKVLLASDQRPRTERDERNAASLQVVLGQLLLPEHLDALRPISSRDAGEDEALDTRAGGGVDEVAVALIVDGRIARPVARVTGRSREDGARAA